MPVMYKQRDLRNTGTSSPPLEPLTGGKVAKRDRVMSAFANPDRLLGNTCRIIGRSGLHGSERFQVTSVDPASGATQVYPTRTMERVALHVKYQPTPGCFPCMSVIANPSGMTGLGGAGWTADVPDGKLKVTATFIGTGSTTVSWLVPLPVSGEVWAGEKQEAGAAWASLSRHEIPLIAPANLQDAATLHLWSECTTCEITVAYVGSPRVVDCVLVERPLGYCREIVSDTVYSSTMVVDQSGKIVGTYPTEYPVDERNGVDPTYGSDNLMDVVDRQAYRLGPILAQWTGWDETTQKVGASEAASVTTTNMSFTGMGGAVSVSTWAAAAPGWSLSSGGTAQDFLSSNSHRETRDANACVSVRVWLLAWRDGTAPATVRVMSADHQAGELTISTDTETWRSFTTHLRCGLGAEDASSLVLLGKVGNAVDTLHIRHMLVEQLDL